MAKAARRPAGGPALLDAASGLAAAVSELESAIKTGRIELGCKGLNGRHERPVVLPAEQVGVDLATADWLSLRPELAAYADREPVGVESFNDAGELVAVRWPECSVAVVTIRDTRRAVPVAVVPHEWRTDAASAERWANRLAGVPLVLDRIEVDCVAAGKAVAAYCDELAPRERALRRLGGVAWDAAVVVRAVVDEADELLAKRSKWLLVEPLPAIGYKLQRAVDELERSLRACRPRENRPRVAAGSKRGRDRVEADATPEQLAAFEVVASAFVEYLDGREVTGGLVAAFVAQTAGGLRRNLTAALRVPSTWGVESILKKYRELRKGLGPNAAAYKRIEREKRKAARSKRKIK